MIHSFSKASRIALYKASLAVLATLISACGTAPSSGQAGDRLHHLEFGGRDRTFIVHRPPARFSGALPLVINFHGGGGHAAAQQQYSGMDTLADQAGFVVVYPNGTGTLSSRLLTWNAGGCCGYAQDHDVDDVGFTLAVIDRLVAQGVVDDRRVYATGLSNGAMMAYRLAARAPGRIAAIAPVAGVNLTAPAPDAAPVAVMHIHSVDDPRALYHGGLGPPFPFTDRRVDHPPVEEGLELWRRHNHCDPVPVEGERMTWTAPSGRAHGATRVAYRHCTPGGEVVLWRLTGAGHVWPGGLPDYYPRLLGPGTAVIDANRRMWDFFRRHSRR